MSLACVGVWSNSDSLSSWWFAEIEKIQKQSVCIFSQWSPKWLHRKGVYRSCSWSLVSSKVLSNSIICPFTRTFKNPILLQKLVFLNLAASITRDFLASFISTFTIFSSHRFLHANMDYVVLLIVFKHRCWVISIGPSLCPNISLFI